MYNKSAVTSGQIFVLLFVNRICIALLSGMTAVGGGNVWEIFLPLIITSAVNFLFLIPIISINRQVRESENSYIHNFYLMKTISIFYGLYFLADIISILLHFSDFAQEMTKTVNSKVIIFILLAAALYGALRGIEAISRFSAVSFAAIILSAVMIFSFLIPSYSSDNLLPFEYFGSNTISSGIVRIFSMTNEAAVLFMLCPLTKGKFMKCAVMWNIFMSLFLTAMLIIIGGSLGEYLIGKAFPFYHIIDGAGILQRFNPFFIGVCISLLFCSITMKLFIVSHCIRIFNPNNAAQKINSRITAIFTGIVFICFLGFYYNRNVGNMIFSVNIWFIMNIVFSFLIPAFLSFVCIYKDRKKRINKKFLKKASALMSVIILLFVSVIFLSGCNNSNNQLNQRLIIQGIGIDKNIQGYYKMTVVAFDTESKDGNNDVKILYTEGKSVEQALSILENKSGKDILLSQCLFIMMNETAADDCKNSLSYFCGRNDMIKTANIMTAEKSSESVITTAIEKMNYHSEDINILSDSRAVNQPSVHFSLFDYMTDLNNNFNDMVIPYIRTDKKLNSLSIAGSTLISERNGTKENLDSNESLGILLINKKASNYTSTIDNDNGITYTIDDISADVLPEINNNHLHIDFNITVSFNKQLDDESAEKAAESLYSAAESAVYKCIIKNGCDVFTINKYIRSIYPEYFQKIEDWDKLLKESDYRINLSVG